MRIIDWISDVCSSDLISAISRRAYGHADGRVVIGDIVVHLDGREPALKGVPMRLSNRESVIFLVLTKYHGHVVARETIYHAVYGLSDRSEEGEGGNGSVSTCKYRWAPSYKKKN